MGIRIGCQGITWGFGVYCDTRRMLKEMKEAGYEGVDSLIVAPTIEDLAEVRKLLWDAGMEVVTVSCGGTFQWRRTILLNAAFGCRLCGDYPAIQRNDVRGIPYPEWAKQMAAEEYDQVAEFGLRYGVTVTMHNHLEFSIESAEEVHELMQRTRHLKLCLDVGHLVGADSDPVEVIRRWPDRIGYVHLKDWKGPRHKRELQVKDYRFVELGQGKVDIKGVMKALEQINYDGWVVVEQDFTERTPLESARMSREYLRGLGY